MDANRYPKGSMMIPTPLAYALLVALVVFTGWLAYGAVIATAANL
jgi:hypothetical protein